MKPMDMMEALGYFPEEDIIEELAYEVPKKRTKFLVSKPFLTGVSAAACLLVTVGLSIGIWARLQKIESRPPLETMTVTQTETMTETASQTTAAPQTTGQKAETTSQTAKATQSTSQQSETSHIKPESTAQSSTQESIPAVNPVTHTQTQPSTKAEETTVSMPQTNASQSVQTPNTETAQTDRTETPTSTTAISTVAGTTATSVEATEVRPTENPPKVDYELLPGFSVTESEDGNGISVTWLSPISPSPEEVISFHTESERFVVEFAGMVSGQYEYWYDIYDTETGKRVRIRMEKRSVFSRNLKADGELTLAFVGDHPGFQYLNEQQCVLYWDNGCYQCSIFASPDEQELLLPIAEAMYPDNE